MAASGSANQTSSGDNAVLTPCGSLGVAAGGSMGPSSMVVNVKAAVGASAGMSTTLKRVAVDEALEVEERVDSSTSNPQQAGAGVEDDLGLVDASNADFGWNEARRKKSKRVKVATASNSLSSIGENSVLVPDGKPLRSHVHGGSECSVGDAGAGDLKDDGVHSFLKNARSQAQTLRTTLSSNRRKSKKLIHSSSFPDEFDEFGNREEVTGSYGALSKAQACTGPSFADQCPTVSTESARIASVDAAKAGGKSNNAKPAWNAIGGDGSSGANSGVMSADGLAADDGGVELESRFVGSVMDDIHEQHPLHSDLACLGLSAELQTLEFMRVAVEDRQCNDRVLEQGLNRQAQLFAVFKEPVGGAVSTIAELTDEQAARCLGSEVVPSAEAYAKRVVIRRAKRVGSHRKRTRRKARFGGGSQAERGCATAFMSIENDDWGHEGGSSGIADQEDLSDFEADGGGGSFDFKLERALFVQRLESLKATFELEAESKSRSPFAGLGFTTTSFKLKAINQRSIEDKAKLQARAVKLTGARRRALLKDHHAGAGALSYLAFDFEQVNAAREYKSTLVAEQLYKRFVETHSALDSGATVTIATLDTWLDQFNASDSIPIRGFDSQVSHSLGKGKIVGVLFDVEGQEYKVVIPDAHKVQGAKVDLLSVNTLVDIGFKLYLADEGSYMVAPDTMQVFTIERCCGLFWVKWFKAIDKRLRKAAGAGGAVAAVTVAGIDFVNELEDVDDLLGIHDGDKLVGLTTGADSRVGHYHDLDASSGGVDSPGCDRAAVGGCSDGRRGYPFDPGGGGASADDDDVVNPDGIAVGSEPKDEATLKCERKRTVEDPFHCFDPSLGDSYMVIEPEADGDLSMARCFGACCGLCDNAAGCPSACQAKRAVMQHCFSSMPVQAVKKKKVPLELMHRRCAHFNADYINYMQKHGMLDVEVERRVKGKCCEACRVAKATRHNPPKSRESSPPPLSPFEHIWSDVKGPLKADYWGNRYMVTFTCEVTRWTVVLFCKTKDQVVQRFEDFLQWVKRQDWKVKKLTTDGGGEYGSGENCVNPSVFEQLCKDEAIEQLHTSAHTPAQNGISERLNRTLCDNAAALLHEGTLDHPFWTLAVKHVCWVRNRMTHSSLKVKDEFITPFAALYKRNAKLSMLRVFGCDTWRFDFDRGKSQLSPKAIRGIFVGVSADRKGWMVFDPGTRSIRTTYHCTFNEDFGHRRDSLTGFKLRVEKAKLTTAQVDELMHLAELFSAEPCKFWHESDPDFGTGAGPKISQDAPAVESDVGLGEESEGGAETVGVSPTKPSSCGNPGGGVIRRKRTSAKKGLEPSRRSKRSRGIAPTQGAPGFSNSVDDDDPEVEGLRDSLRKPYDGADGAEPRDSDSEEPQAVLDRDEDLVGGSDAESDDDKQEDYHELGHSPVGELLPVRRLAVGLKEQRTEEHDKFLNFAFVHDWPVVLEQLNPKQGTKCRKRYELYKKASTLREILRCGGSWADVENDYDRGYIVFKRVEGTVAEWKATRSSKEKDASVFYSHAYSRLIGAQTFEDSIRDEFAMVGIDHINSLRHSTQELLKKALGSQTLTEFAHCCAARILLPEPLTVQQALNSEYAKEWRAAMDEEIANLIKFNCFRRVPKSEAIKHGRLVKSKWVFHVKYNPDNSVQRFRARLVACGFSQKPGSDYYETYSPVFSYTSLRSLLAHATRHDMQIDQWDLKNGFIQQDIDVDHMYMACPAGYSDMMDDGVTPAALHCIKSIYGLKQSSRLLHNRLSAFLKKQGFRQLVSDQCVYIKGSGDDQVIIATWVDDIVMLSKRENKSARILFDLDLRQEFEVSPWTSGEAGWLLNIKIVRDWDAGTLHMSQEAAIEKLALRFNLCGDHAAKPYTPMDPKLKLRKPVNSNEVVHFGEFDYMSAVGGLLYISLTTRPDVAYSVGVLSRYMACPTEKHVEATKRVIQYLYRTKKFGIRYCRTPQREGIEAPHIQDALTVYRDTKYSSTLEAEVKRNARVLDEDEMATTYVDADLAGDEDTMRSTTGFAIVLHGGIVSYMSKLQPTVALSTSEAETNAAVEAVKQICHTRLFLKEIGCEQKFPTIMYEDNNATISFSKGTENSKRTKHYQMKVHFLQEKNSIDFIMRKAKTVDQLADCFTKALPSETFTKFRRWMGVVIPQPDATAEENEAPDE